MAVDPEIPSEAPSLPASTPQQDRISTSESLQRELSGRRDSLTSIELLGSEKSLLALYRQAEGPDVKGAVLVLPDTGQHPDWPLAVRPVRAGLAEHGWHTLSMTMSASRPVELPERSLPSKNRDGVFPSREAPADGAPPDPAEDSAAVDEGLPDDLQRAVIGYQWLDALETDQTAIVGIGSRGEIALQAWLDLQLDAGRVALVLVNADLSAERLKQINAQAGRLNEAAILDVFDPLDKLSSKLAAGRLRSFERMDAARYSQIKISGLAKETGQLGQRLTRSIRGWLEKRAFSKSGRQTMR